MITKINSWSEYMDGLKISFERGGILYAKFLNNNSTTITNIKKFLPYNTEVCHTRWCGREIFMPLKTDNKIVGNDLTRFVSKFDLVYWLKEKGDVHEETISIFYGAESLRYYGGPLYVEIIGRILVEQEELFDEIGRRIWLEGREKVFIEISN